jgi:probable HAF family extracellular repeat protein
MSAWARYLRRPIVNQRRIRRGQKMVTRRSIRPQLEILEERCLLYAITDLGTLGGGSSGGIVNNSGQVAGSAQTASGDYHAFIWDSSHGMQDLGTLGGPSSQASALNNNGQVVGMCLTATSGGNFHAFVWDSTHGMQDIGTLGGTTSQAVGNNDSGQVFGQSYTESGSLHAFEWDSSHGMQDLGTLGGTISQAFAMNVSGQGVGESSTASGANHAFVWDSTHGMQDLGSLGGIDSIGYGSNAGAINSSGQVVGYAATASGSDHAFVWDSSHGMQDLGTLGGTRSLAMAINDSGQVVGTAQTASGDYHAFVWDSTHGMQDLGTLGGTFGEGDAINASGQVVGHAKTANGDFHAFVWDSTHGMRDLLAPSPLGGTSSEAGSINASGQVSGIYTTSGSNYHAFLASLSANSPAFSALSSPTIVYGTATTTLSGHLADGLATPPAGETVSVTFNGVTQNAVLDGSGNFSTTFSTGSVHVGPALPIGYIYPGDPNFNGATGSSTLTVGPAPLTVTADNQTMFYGAALPTFTASYSGFLNGDTAASLTTPPSLNTTATAASPVGSYPITAVGASDPNYNISYVGGTLTIFSRNTTTTLTSSLSSLSAGQPVTLTATVSAVSPGAGTPTGNVDFVDTANNTDLGTASLSGGSASLTVSSLLEDASLPGGVPHSIVANYKGDNNFSTSDSSAAPVSIVVTDVPATVAVTSVLPVDASNNPTAPVGTLLSLGGSFSDSPVENRPLSTADVVSWAVTLNGQPYSLPGSVATNGPTFSFTPTAVGTYVVTLSGVADPDGGISTGAQQTVDITSMDAVSLQNVVNTQAYWINEGTKYENGNFSGGYPQPSLVTLQADPTQISAAQTALNAIVMPIIYDSNTDPFVVPVTVTLNLTNNSYTDLNFNLQPGITVIVNGVNGSTTVVGNSPALTITSGNVTVNNVTFTTATDAPTILVAGGSLALRNDVVQESTGFADAAISVTGGTVDLGSTGNPGNNTININGAGQLVQNTTSSPISTAGNTFESGGTVLAGSNFTSASLTAGTAPVIPGQAVTFTATVAPAGSGTPTGSVTFTDATSGVTLGTAPLTNGVAALTTPLAGAVGAHVIQANYNGDSTFLPSLATATQWLTQSIYVLNATASGAVSVSGNASINLPGNLIVDSSSKTALTETGNAKITAASIEVVGGVSQTTGTTLTPAATTGVAAVTDPMTGLKGPGTTGMTNCGAVNLSGSSTLTISQGIYSSIKVSGSASLTLNPGIYIIEGGGFTVTGKASVNGAGVLIYNTGSNYPNNTGSFGGLTISGSGTVSLSAMTTGTYAGIVIFQPAANTRAISLSGNAANGLTGTVYAPAALLTLGGNATLAGAAVVNQLSLSGNASSTQSSDGSDVSAGSTPGELVAGDVLIYINDPTGLFTSDELARIQDAVNAVNALVAPYGVTVAETTDSTAANVTLDTGSTSAAGGYTNGVLGCWNPAGSEITMIQGWNWYAGSDPTQIGATQYDFETTLTHELGHAIGLGESTNAASAMSGTLATGTVIRALTTADLAIPAAEPGADAQRAAGFVGQVSNLSYETSAEKPGFQGRNRFDSDLVFALLGVEQLPLGSLQLQGRSSLPSRNENALPVDAIFASVGEQPSFAGSPQQVSADPQLDAPLIPDLAQDGQVVGSQVDGAANAPTKVDDYVPADSSWQE